MITSPPEALSQKIQLRFLCDEEKSAVTHERELPLVIEPIKENTFQTLIEIVKQHSAWFNHQKDNYGAILFRGFAVETADQFQFILELLNINLVSTYHFGSAERVRAYEKIFTSSEAPENTIIPPHNELNMVPNRPDSLAFFCQTEPPIYGETPIVDTGKLFQSLPFDLRVKFSELPQKYVRFVPVDLLGTVFENLNYEQIDELLREQKFDFRWRSDGSLDFACSYIPVFSHPRTGRLCFGLSTCDCLVTREWYRNTMSRYSFWQKLRHGFLPAETYRNQMQGQTSFATVCQPAEDPTGTMAMTAMHQQNSTLDMYLVNEHGSCTKMTVAEARELGRAEWRNAVIFPWRQGDILVIDNLQVAHGRLNVRSPRKILTAFGNMCNIRDMKPVGLTARYSS